GFGLESAALSVELTIRQVSGLAAGLGRTDRASCPGYVSGLPTDEGSSRQGTARPGPIALEAVVYGRLPLMISEYCPVGCAESGFDGRSKCSGCCSRGDFALRDRLGKEFPVFCDSIDCRSTI